MASLLETADSQPTCSKAEILLSSLAVQLGEEVQTQG